MTSQQQSYMVAGHGMIYTVGTMMTTPQALLPRQEVCIAGAWHLGSMQPDDGPEKSCRSKVLITATGGARGKKPIELKKIADAALDISRKNGFQVCPSPSVPPCFCWPTQSYLNGVVNPQVGLSCCSSINLPFRSPHGLCIARVFHRIEQGL